VRDFGSKRSSTSDRDEQATAARHGPGKRTLTELLPATSAPAQRSAEAAVQRKADAAAAMSTSPRPGNADPADRRAERPPSDSREPDAAPRPTIFELFAAGVQRKANGAEHDTEQIHASAQRGLATAAEPLPHGQEIQRLFGRHDVSGVQAHVGGDAARASREIGAQAYAMGNHVAFAQAPDLRTAAHEAAHVVQQRGGVSLSGGVGESGDAHESHADQVAELVARGASAEHLLDSYSPKGAGSAGATSIQSIQMMKFEDIASGRYYQVRTSRGTGTYFLKTKRSAKLTKGRPEFTFVESEETRGAYVVNMIMNPSFVIYDEDQILAEVGAQTGIEVGSKIVDQGRPDEMIEAVGSQQAQSENDGKKEKTSRSDEKEKEKEKEKKPEEERETDFTGSRHDYFAKAQLPDQDQKKALDSILYPGGEVGQAMKDPNGFWKEFTPCIERTLTDYERDAKMRDKGRDMGNVLDEKVVRTLARKAQDKALACYGSFIQDATFDGNTAARRKGYDVSSKDVLHKQEELVDNREPADLDQILLKATNYLIRLTFGRDKAAARLATKYGLDLSSEEQQIQLAPKIQGLLKLHRPQILHIQRNWPGEESPDTGAVFVQLALTPGDKKHKEYWSCFQTMIHEFLHACAHARFLATIKDAGGALQDITLEGMCDFFAERVWLRGGFEDVKGIIRGQQPAKWNDAYAQIEDVKKMEAIIGYDNLVAAYFLGHVEMIGLGGWKELSEKGTKGSRTHRTIAGDNINTIARQHQVPPELLKDANVQITDWDTLPEGSLILVPDKREKK
jgi:hypothetical protein